MGRQGAQWKEGRRGSRSTAGGMERDGEGPGLCGRESAGEQGRPDGNRLASESARQPCVARWAAWAISCKGFLDTMEVLLPLCFPNARTYFGGGPCHPFL